MYKSDYTQEEIAKFLDEIIITKLTRAIYQQLIEDGGNTAQGLSETLKEKGVKASLTRVYEEIIELVKNGLVKRVSKRPPIYTTIQTPENYERIALKFIMNSREDLLRRWAAIYPFLPNHMRTSDFFAKGLSSGHMLNFNPYPIVDIFTPEGDGLKRYLLRIFENNKLLIANTYVDTLLSGDNYHKAFEKEKFESLITVIKENYKRNGRLTLNSISDVHSFDIKTLTESSSLSKFYAQFFQYIDYELRQTTEYLSSFVVGDGNVIFPIGIGTKNQPTYSLIEIREPKIVKKSKNAFNKIWGNATRVIKIENGQIIRE
ncbi:MAG: hypothetical protein ACTSP7_12095 [Candidatus Heimdallarchaeota archaeon]